MNGGSASGTLSAMAPLPPPLAFFCLLFAGWVNRQQQAGRGLRAWQLVITTNQLVTQWGAVFGDDELAAGESSTPMRITPCWLAC